MELQEEIDLYKILEINYNANNKEIKRAYKKLILKYHPDKNNNIGSDKFIKIKYAYDILSNEQLKNNYDLKRKYLDTNFIDLLNLLKKFYKYENYIIIFKIIINKIIFQNFIDFKNKLFDNIQFFEINNLININIDINFTIKEIWDNKPKFINYKRITKKPFEEYIYPLDNKQIYEKEGEKIDFNNYEGDFIVNINLEENEYNNEKYYIYNNNLYIFINKNRINNNNVKVNYLDNNMHNFNLINEEETIFGNLFYVNNFGLPYYNTKKEIIDTNNEKYFIMQGKLFFIILL